MLVCCLFNRALQKMKVRTEGSNGLLLAHANFRFRHREPSTMRSKLPYANDVLFCSQVFAPRRTFTFLCCSYLDSSVGPISDKLLARLCPQTTVRRFASSQWKLSYKSISTLTRGSNRSPLAAVWNIWLRGNWILLPLPSLDVKWAFAATLYYVVGLCLTRLRLRC